MNKQSAENARIAALKRYRLLDTEPDDKFDAINNLAAQICDAPIALITLIDRERTWIKSRVGVDFVETPREISFCAHAIDRPQELLTVEDATTDERFRYNVFVTGAPYIRFYTGVPIVTPDGFAVGRLCVIDMKPRSLSTFQKQTLRTLAAQIAVIMELSLKVRLLEREIKSRKLAERNLRRADFRDELTGLPNRTFILERITQTTANRRAALGSAVLCVDIDRFRTINESLGHAMGDALLVAVGTRLADALRSEDSVGRYGGDQFVVIATDVEGAPDAETVAKRVLATFEAPFVINGRSLAVTGSVGITMLGTPYRSAGDIIRDADIAVSGVKLDGGDSFSHFFPELRQRAVARLQCENDLRVAVERGELRLHYQPIIELESEKIIGFEALVRWQHPNRGLVMPDAFIAVAEESGLIGGIGDWVLLEACRQLRHWQIQEPTFTNLSVNVNVSARQFAAGTVYDSIARALQATSLAPHSLNAEITETAMMKHSAAATEAVLRLKGLGVAVQLDDFGCGYSSLSYLRSFPVRGLKVDRSFVSGAGPEIVDPEIVEAVLGLAAKLGLDVTAEGIESREQLTFLREQGCLHGQGYLFSKPLPAEQVPAFVAAYAERTRAVVESFA